MYVTEIKDITVRNTVNPNIMQMAYFEDKDFDVTSTAITMNKLE